MSYFKREQNRFILNFEKKNSKNIYIYLTTATNLNLLCVKDEAFVDDFESKVNDSHFLAAVQSSTFRCRRATRRLGSFD